MPDLWAGRGADWSGWRGCEADGHFMSPGERKARNRFANMGREGVVRKGLISAVSERPERGRRAKGLRSDEAAMPPASRAGKPVVHLRGLPPK